MNFDLIVIIVLSYLAGVITTKMSSKCSTSDDVVVDHCPYSNKESCSKK